MIRNTHAATQGQIVLSTYRQCSGHRRLSGDAWRQRGSSYEFVPAKLDILMKVETHNHPTAIAPFPGAATGAGGKFEMRRRWVEALVRKQAWPDFPYQIFCCLKTQRLQKCNRRSQIELLQPSHYD